VDRGIGIAPADNGQRLAACHTFGHLQCSPAENIHFKHPHRSVPDNGFRILEDCVETFCCGRPDIQRHPPGGNFLYRHHLGVNRRIQIFRHHDIQGKINLDVFFPRFGKDGAGRFNHILFYFRFTDVTACAFQECIGHGASDDDFVHVPQHVFQGRQFTGNLGASDDDDQGTFRVGHGLFEIIQFLFEEEAGGMHRYMPYDGNNRRIGSV